MNREKKNRRLRRRRVLAFSVLSLLLAAVLFGISFAGIFVTLHIPDIKAMLSDGYVFRFYAAESPDSALKRLSYDAGFICRQGSLYLDFTTLSELCGFAVSGDAGQRRYLLGEGDFDSLTVNLGTTSVLLCGQPVSMRAPSFLAEDGSLYLPCEFVGSYFRGITVETEKENDHFVRVICDARTGYGLTVRKDAGCREVEPPDSQPDGDMPGDTLPG